MPVHAIALVAARKGMDIAAWHTYNIYRMCAYLTRRGRFLSPLLLAFMLGVFCAPYTFFDEASDYLADTESELVHYYLTPLPDNGEACVEPPRLDLTFTAALAPFVRDCPILISCPVHSFFHPPE